MAEEQYAHILWSAEDSEQARQWRRELIDKGVNFVHFEKNTQSPHVGVVFAVPIDRVEAITGKPLGQQYKVLSDVITMSDIVDNPNFMAIARRIKEKEETMADNEVDRQMREQLIDLLEEISGYRYDSLEYKKALERH